VTVGKPTTAKASTLTPGKISKKIRSQYNHGLKQCFKRVLEQDPDAAGTIKATFVIGERGSVTAASLRGFGYPELNKCVEAKLLKWRFPKPADKDGNPTSLPVNVDLGMKGV
jgi:hypothetical protein